MTGFLDLPPEIRNHVYYHTESLVPTKCNGSTDKKDGGHPVDAGKVMVAYQPARSDSAERQVLSPLLPPKITHTCRIIRRETLSIFYGANPFLLMDVYFILEDDMHKSFVDVVVEMFETIEPHLPLVKRVDVLADCVNVQNANEVVSLI